MTEFTDQDLTGSRFTKVRLNDSTFRNVDFTGGTIRGSDLVLMVIRAVDVNDTQIDAPWIYDTSLLVNDVDVVPLVEAELNRRFPGRDLRRASEPESLAAAWTAVEQSWAAVLARAEALPAGSVDVQIAGEWSLSQTLRHLVLCTDMWLLKAVLGQEQPFHPVGQIDSASAHEVNPSWFIENPTWQQVLEARADRMRIVREFIAAATPELLAEARANPHAPQYPETVLSCVHCVLEEEWEHQRYAVRDLSLVDAQTTER